MEAADEVREAPETGPAGAFLVRLGRALHESGFPAPELESALHGVARRLGIVAQFFSTPTSLLTALGEGLEQRTHLERVEPSGVDLGRLALLDQLIRRVVAGDLSPARAHDALERALGRHRPYPLGLVQASWALASAATAVFLGGGWNEMGVAALLGLATGLLSSALAGRSVSGLLLEPIAAALAAFGAAAAASRLEPLSIYIATLSGIIYLIPGFTLTVALAELATRHLSSGTARFASALMVFLSLTFGVALGGHAAAALFGAPVHVPPTPPGPWVEVVALLVAPFAYIVLYRAPLAELPWVALVGFLGLQAGRIGGDLTSPELGMFLGALAVGLASRFYERLRRRPRHLTLVPSILLLVPGTIGYRSFASLLESDVVLGIQTAFRMILIAVSLVAGLLASYALAPRSAAGDP
ncbi:MAG: threonine/serine exporter family protein [Acidobacteria bacterium]|nr:threonine/serine exporter family protein [Acidobacteriota bacterium]